MEFAVISISTMIVFVVGLFLGGKVFSKTDIRTKIKLENVEKEKAELLDKMSNQEEKLVNLERESATSIAEKKSLNEKIVTHGEELKQMQENFKNQFENLANKIFDQKSNQFQKESEKGLANMFGPLEEKIRDFKKKIEDTYNQESRERFALKSEIEKIVVANQKMTEETSNLTRALKGDVKAQGNWGELVLERVLEASGLRDGEEYILQGKNLGLKNEDGRSHRPDVIVNLPEDKHIIIDSKVSLTHYERFISTDKSDEKSEALKDFLGSIRAHIDGLSGKKYQFSEKLETPDFVLMFFPIEGAFSLALQSDSKLFLHAWNKSIVVVSPTTLLATLRTVASIWKQEKQNKNAMKIAIESGRLYDKFAGFAEDLEKIGESIRRTDDSYHGALSKLKTGKGNILSKIETIKRLGAKTSKKLPNVVQVDELDDTI